MLEFSLSLCSLSQELLEGETGRLILCSDLQFCVAEVLAWRFFSVRLVCEGGFTSVMI